MVEALPDYATRLGPSLSQTRSNPPQSTPLTAQARRKSSVLLGFDDFSSLGPAAHAFLARQRKSSNDVTAPLKHSDALSDFLSKQANVRWASSLPTKAQRVYFSHEEQLSIAAAVSASPRSRCPSVTRFDPVGSLSSSAGKSSLSATSATESPAMEGASPSQEQQQPLYHWQGQQAFLDDYHQRIATAQTRDKANEHKSRSRRPSFKRTISLISENRTRSSADLTSPPASVAHPSRKSWASPRKPLTRSNTDTVVFQPPPQGPLQYYQDPRTRLKLREYLGSPKGFDEALTHGFPAAVALPEEELEPPRPRTSVAIPRSSMASHRGATNDASKFLRNEVLSWLENSDEEDNSIDEMAQHAVDEETGQSSPSIDDTNETFDVDDYPDRDEISSPEMQSPITPHNMDFITSIRPKSARYAPHALPAASMPASPRSPPPMTQIEWPLSNRTHDYPGAYSTPASPSTPAWPAAREMTIRMTLTRPELRASDESIYGNHTTGPGSTPTRFVRKQVAADPMELPSLHEITLEGEEHERAASIAAGRGHARKKSLWRKMSIGGIRK